MKKRIIGAAIGLAMLGGAGFIGTSSADGHQGGCPSGDGWVLSSVIAVVESVDNGNYADQNGDGLSCFRFNKGQSAKNNFASFTWKDNTN